MLVRSDRMHRRSTSSGDMPGPLSATASSLPIDADDDRRRGDPGLLAGVERVVDQLLEGGPQPVVPRAAHALRELGLGRELEVAREREDGALDRRGHDAHRSATKLYQLGTLGRGAPSIRSRRWRSSRPSMSTIWTFAGRVVFCAAFLSF